jgi:hypothetical protein
MSEALIYGKALSNALSFDILESGSSKLFVKNKATGDAHWMCNSIVNLHIAWASALLVQTNRAMPEPQDVGCKLG